MHIETGEAGAWQFMLFSALKEWARSSHMAMNRGGNMETLKESRGDNDDQMMIQALEKKRAQTC